MYNLIKNSYQGKKVFLTGHTGFKGSWMLGVLNYLGAEVKGYALDPEDSPNLYSILDGNSLCQSVTGDIRDREHLKAEILSFTPDYIFHMAAQSLVRRSYEQPVETFDVNVMGTVHLLDAIRELKNTCQVVVITTDKVYENRESWDPYHEADPLGGFDPYSSSKAAAEIAVASYRRSFFHPQDYSVHKKSIASARAGNVIGGGDWAKDRIIPDMVRALEKGEVLQVRNPESVRPWQHVLEPVIAYLFLGARMAENPEKFAQAYNFGPFEEDNLTVAQLVELGLKSWGSGEYEVANESSAPHEAKLLRLDISKAINELKWRPHWNSSIALKATMEWYQHYRSNAREVTLNQIISYLQS